jgi:hypothetical protein
MEDTMTMAAIMVAIMADITAATMVAATADMMAEAAGTAAVAIAAEVEDTDVEAVVVAEAAVEEEVTSPPKPPPRIRSRAALVAVAAVYDRSHPPQKKRPALIERCYSRDGSGSAGGGAGRSPQMSRPPPQKAKLPKPPRRYLKRSNSPLPYVFLASRIVPGDNTPPMRLPLLCLLAALLLLGSARAAEPFFKKDDVIALIGGEDMVVASEYGYLETLITRALPDYHLRFRSLAWEGDTVYEQRRDLNFPSWEEQLDKIGATVVICQFGAMESLAGRSEIAKFSAAYAALLQRIGGNGQRRLILLSPFTFAQSVPWGASDSAHVAWEKGIVSRAESQLEFSHAIEAFDSAHTTPVAPPPLDAKLRDTIRVVNVANLNVDDAIVQRDGIHLNRYGHTVFAQLFCLYTGIVQDMRVDAPDLEPLRQLVVAKNKLWFDYWRVQNWAFLAGDRTNQPSSRDHRDPSKRWFPAEREEFIPLIEAKEKEIDALAAKLAGK